MPRPPRKLKPKEYVKAKVRLLRDLSTRGGLTLRKGVLMRVVDSTTHGLHLRTFVRGWAYDITQCSVNDVEVVELAAPPPAPTPSDEESQR